MHDVQLSNWPNHQGLHGFKKTMNAQVTELLSDDIKDGNITPSVERWCCLKAYEFKQLTHNEREQRFKNYHPEIERCIKLYITALWVENLLGEIFR